MVELIPTFKTHLAQTATTLCSAWELKLPNGKAYGLTNHDAPFFLNGTNYIPQASLSATDSDHRLNFQSDGGSFTALFDLPELTAQSLQDGYLDDAVLTQYTLNWQRPEDYVIAASGRIANLKISDHGFSAEWVGHASKLERNTGRVFSQGCDASLGDARCGVNLNALPTGMTCSKTLSACRDQFENASNFRGFPYLLGDDALQAAPQIGERRDGSSRYK
ncbi:DUF2163 domain-containing protein [Litorimonas sp. RW-G-Af-16]|uniref:DUF2163 domain-containing protein n=1 Tax=Litorimonas sp. RW-G-Af-16 TaxID=3241168 RepID=UPI003AAC58F5